MILDESGVTLLPGNRGKDCPANGLDPKVECCCDECDYMMCCLDDPTDCASCTDTRCPRSPWAV